jgi:aminoglycoside phosphotransferase (APT) family kinase protein
MMDAIALPADQDLRRELTELGLLGPEDAFHAEPLTGGVSSDILKITAGARVFAVKRALPKLKVAADWRAPVERNAFEVAWLEVAGRIVPGAVPRVLARSREGGLFAMEYLAPELHPVWKAELRRGRIDPAFAAEVGRRLVAIHAATADDSSIARRFATDHIFHPIRLEPYLEATATRHTEVAATLMDLSRRTLATKRALVHGDVSPKNILVGPGGPVFLDAECAWYGDPAFDLAFCLNHLLLKCLWAPREAAPALLASFAALAASYLDGVVWEPRAALAARAGQLLPALFLARIDGKSPVEYITTEADKALVRRVALRFLKSPPATPTALCEAWGEAIGPS